MRDLDAADRLTEITISIMFFGHLLQEFDSRKPLHPRQPQDLSRGIRPQPHEGMIGVREEFYADAL
jgi:hypothetical protein